MSSLFYLFGQYYYVVLILQAICVYHCVRKGNQNWIWLIVFLPLVGCVIYLFTEVITKNKVRNVQSGVGEVFRPSGSIKKLQENLRFSDTFQNKIALADALFAAGQTD